MSSHEIENIQEILCRLHGARLILLKTSGVSGHFGHISSSVSNYLSLTIEEIKRNEDYIVMTPHYPCIFPWDRILNSPSCPGCMRHWTRPNPLKKEDQSKQVENALQLITKAQEEIRQTHAAWTSECMEFLAEARFKLERLPKDNFFYIPKM
nr:hypothetical protein [uncultured Desulfuromonas sp.]